MERSSARAGRLATLVTLVAACGADPARPATRAPQPLTLPDGAVEPTSTEDAAAPPPTLDELAARAVRVAPGMRELARGEVSVPVSIGLPKIAGDACVRVAFAAKAPVKALLESTTGDELAAAEPATDGVLGPRGPVCIRRGQGFRLSLEGSVSPVRYVVWVAP